MSNRTTRWVRVIDTEAMLPIARMVWLALYGEEAPANLAVAEQAIVVAYNDDIEYADLAVVHPEGVGFWLEGNNTLPVWVKVGRSENRLPVGLLRIVVAEEAVNFADHVRVFGDRLEANWSLWERRMAKVTKVPEYLIRFEA